MISELVRSLSEQYKYKIEMHCHSMPASACGEFTPEEVVRTSAEHGYSGIVLTNHFMRKCICDGESDAEYVDRYLEDYYRARREGERIGLEVILGLELRVRANSNDYLIYGTISREDAIRMIGAADGTLEHFRELVPPSEDKLLIQAHPCRHGCMRAEPDLLDGVEVLNLHPRQKGATSFAAKFAREVGGVITSGSDFHHPGTAGMGGIYTAALPHSGAELVAVLRSGDYLLDIGGIPALPGFM